MRKLLTWIGAAALITLIVGVPGFGYLAWVASGLDNEGRIYSDQATIAVVQHWNAAALKDRASPELLASIKPDQLASLFHWFGTLGALKSVAPCSGQVNVNVTIVSGRTTSGQFTCNAKFESGDATVSLLIFKNQGKWQIAGFRVNSPALIPREQGGKT